MGDRPREQAETDRADVSTGHLPPSDVTAAWDAEAHSRSKPIADGRNSDVYPALARVPGELFGICLLGSDGRSYAAGDADYEFSIMSISKPFVFALVCQEIGAEEARAKIGANATGLAFEFALRHRKKRGWQDQPYGERRRHRDDEPHPGKDHGGKVALRSSERPVRICRPTAFIERRSPRVSLAEQSQKSEHRASASKIVGRIYSDPASATDLYTKQCSLNVSARDLAAMAATSGRRWRQSTDPAAGGRCAGLPLRAGNDGHRKAVRDLRRLAVRDRHAGEERN